MSVKVKDADSNKRESLLRASSLGGASLGYATLHPGYVFSGSEDNLSASFLA